MPFSLAGHTAVVTGNSTGLGKAIGLALGKAGAKVPVNFANNEARARRALDEYQSAGIATCLVRSDVTTEEGVARLFAETEAQLGKVDIVVPNATCEQPQKPIEEYDWNFYQCMIEFFIKSPFLLTRQALPHMKQQRWGRIINISSVEGKVGKPGLGIYVTAKHAINGLTKTMAQETGTLGITVNALCPGVIETDIVRAEGPAAAAAMGLTYEQLIDRFAQESATKRIMEVEDVANVAVLLASDIGAGITGSLISIDGGTSPY